MNNHHNIFLNKAYTITHTVRVERSQKTKGGGGFLLLSTRDLRFLSCYILGGIPFTYFLLFSIFYHRHPYLALLSSFVDLARM
jgi:hypothetical protein